MRAHGDVLFLIANPRELSAEEHPFVARLAGALADTGRGGAIAQPAVAPSVRRAGASMAPAPRDDV